MDNRYIKYVHKAYFSMSIMCAIYILWRYLIMPATLDKPKKTTHKVNVSLSNDVLEKLKAIASELDVSMTEAIRIAIKTESYIQQEIGKGGKILVEKPDKTFREIVFR